MAKETYPGELEALRKENHELKMKAHAGFDFMRVKAWYDAGMKKPAVSSFTAGGERDAAYLIEHVVAKERAGRG